MDNVTITLGGKERHPRLTLSALVEFRKRTGKSIMAGFDANKMTEDDLLTLTWVCLRHEDKELTIEQVGDMVDIGNITQVTTAIAQAVEQSQVGGDPLAQTPTG